MNKITIIDGNSLLFRAYYATIDYRDPTNIMKNSAGVPTNAIFAFSNMIVKILSTIKQNEGLFVAFDTGKKTFRHLDDEEYKANRKDAPDDLKVQFPIAREFLNALNIFTFELDGFEADDLAGTVATIATNNNLTVDIYTSDRDYLQLINNNTTIKLIKKGMSDIVDFDEKALLDEYNFTPNYMVDYKALVGDASDNIKGIPGVGPKTAIKLINEYGHLDDIFANSDNIKGKIGQTIKENVELAKHALFLASIKCDVDLPFTLDGTLYKGYEHLKITNFANKYELRQLLSRLPSFELSNNEEELSAVEIQNINDLQIKDKLAFSLLLNDEVNYLTSDITGIVLTIGKNNYFLNKTNFLQDQKLIKILENPLIEKYTYDFKRQKVNLSKFNIDLQGLKSDILLAAYILDSNIKDNIATVFEVLNIPFLPTKDSDLLKTMTYCSYYAINGLELIENKLKEIESLDIYRNVEIPLNNVLAKMEIEGFPLNIKTLNEIGDNYKNALEQLSQDIYNLVGYEFNINSPKQIGVLLFDELGLPSNKKRSTSVEALSSLIGHPIVDKILSYRKYAKLISTYIEGLTSSIHSDNKIHCSFNQALTTTGRLSSSNPNMQNISIRDEEGRLIRKAFFYEQEDYKILSFDYSQIELRLLASIANCAPLIETFNAGYDVHQATADALFGPLAQDSDSRRKAKAVNFGIVYGISDWGLSEQISVDVKEAKQIINTFYENYPEIATFRINTINEVSKKGYVKTLINRRRYIPEIFDSSYQIREFAKRAATNAPIQGSAADLIKIAMIEVDAYLSKNNFKTKLVLQIHDELIFKLHKDEEKVVCPVIREIMENAIKLSVKLHVDQNIGHTWFEAK